MDAAVHLIITYQGKTYSRRSNIRRTGVCPAGSGLLRETEYQTARAWEHIKRDIDDAETQVRTTNPFAWS